MSSGKQPSLATSLSVVAIAAAIGFAAIYATRGSSDNAVEGGAQPSATGSGQGGASAGKVSGMAGFVKRNPPQAIADVEFTGPDGAPMKLSNFKGKTVLLNLWATWCAPCRKEMPSLDRLQKALGSEKFEVVALAVDRAGVETAAKFLTDTKVESLKLYIDTTAKTGSALLATGLPTTILIGHDGKELGRFAGPAEWDSADAKALVEAALR